MAYPKTTAVWTLQPKQGLGSMKLDQEASLADLQENECLVKIEAVSLNYRDAGIPNDNYPAPAKADLVPCSDAAGTVVAVGSKVQLLKVGDRVCSLFNPKHQSGILNSSNRGYALGGKIDGVLCKYAIFHETGLIHAPENLTLREASTLPCAAVTAWNSLFGLSSRQLRPGDTLLAQGTGGVSLFAVQFAAALGATVIATTSSDKKVDLLKKLGATHVINYRTDPNWGESAKALTPDKEGVHHIIEVGGDATMAQSLEAIRPEGVISIIGFLGGNSPQDRPSFLECLLQLAVVRGVNVGSKDDFTEMNAFLNKHTIHPVIDSQEFKFEDAPKAFQYLWDAKHTGKIVIDVDGH